MSRNSGAGTRPPSTTDTVSTIIFTELRPLYIPNMVCEPHKGVYHAVV